LDSKTNAFYEKEGIPQFWRSRRRPVKRKKGKKSQDLRNEIWKKPSGRRLAKKVSE